MRTEEQRVAEGQKLRGYDRVKNLALIMGAKENFTVLSV